MTPLNTERLLIREFALDDLDAVRSLHADSAQADQWLQWTVRNYAALSALHQPPYGDYAVALRQAGEVVGAVGLVPCLGPFELLPYFGNRLAAQPSGAFTTEMGLFWSIHPSHRRRGYALEAARALSAFAFERLQMDRLVATTTNQNVASIGVMRRLGMVIERNPQALPEWFQTIGVLPRP